MKEVRLERSCTPVPGVKQIFPSPHHPHDVPPIRAAAPHFFCSTQRRFPQRFASRLRQGRGRRSPAEYSRRNIRFPGKLRPGRKYGRPYVPAESFPPQESPQDKRKEKSPEKIWQEEGKFPSMACALPFPLRSRNMPRSRGMCGTSVCRKKTPPRRKACCGTCRCTGGSREKNLHRPHSLRRKRAECA